MNSKNMPKIKNILFWGNKIELAREANEIKKNNDINLSFASTFKDFQRILDANIINLIIIDSNHSSESINEILEFYHKIEFSNIPIVLLIEEESIEKRCQYFNKGISSFVQKGDYDNFVDSIRRIERELTFKDGLKNMSIAVLDDDRLQLAIMKDMLERNSLHNVDFYSNPIDLIKAEKSYDVYLVDLILPEIDGEIVMLEMRKRHENSVIIGISSIEKKSTIARVLSIGANDYITKPVNEQVFMAKLYSNSRILMLLHENELKNKILQELAIKDGLTSLYNHKHIHEILDTDIKMAKRYSRPLSLIMLDIDNFKGVNDSYGHQFGDEVLTAVARCIKSTVRESDVVGRYGGEEFIIICPETVDKEAVNLANRIRVNVNKINFEKKLNITISGGVSKLEKDSEQLIYDADKLLYKSKHTGKNKIEFIEIIKESNLSSWQIGSFFLH